MTENGSGPHVIEGPGRYKVFAAPDGSWIVARSGPLCERCENCGCGEQADPIVIPSMIISLAGSSGFSLGRAKEMFKAVRGQK